jgi:hypothetical protein
MAELRPLNPPHEEDGHETIPVFISAGVNIINGERTYWLANQNIDEMSLEELKGHIVSLMNDEIK